MKKWFKSCTAAILSATLLLSASVCMASQPAPAYEKLAGKTAKLQWYINFSWFPRPDYSNPVHQQIIKDTGVDIEFVIPAGNEAEKLNSMIASDTLPDLVTLGWWEGAIKEIIDAEMVYPLNELADKYDPYFWTVADEGRLGWYTSDDGNVYQYPNASFSPADYEKNDNIAANITFLVRKDMYEAIGSPDMTTPEGFKQAIRDAAKAFPTVNGQPLIPLGAAEFTAEGNVSFQGDLQDFLAVPREDEDGNVYDRESDPDYKNWLKTFRQLGEEGYLSDDIFIDQRAQMEEKIAQGRYFAMIYQRTDLADQQKLLYAQDPESIYMAVDGPKNSNGDPHEIGGVGISGWTVTLISKKCKDPERAISLLSYLMGEEAQKLITYGPEGVGYDMVKGQPVEKAEAKALKQDNMDEYSRKIGGDNAYWMLMDTATQLQWASKPEPPLGQMETWTYPYVINTAEYSFSLAIDSEESIIDMKVKNLFGSTLPKLLLAKTDAEFDKLFDEYTKKKKELGYDKVLAEKTRQLKINKEKLGIE